ncbi:CU044_5270 family protein [Streptomyces sp. KL116D]|uniref:CU044_5270 family protein n=1 Tax=Streptomyces sp. KL116D TaxID=3045152 RepID=UPI003557A739
MTAIPPSHDRDLPPGRHRVRREHLLREIAPQRPGPVRPSWRRPAFLAPAAAAALTIAVVVGVTVTRDASPVRPEGGTHGGAASTAAGPTASSRDAAELLERIADRAERRTAPTAADDEFVYLRRVAYFWKTDPDKKPGGDCATTSEGHEDGLVELWVSADGEHTGLRRERGTDGRPVDRPIVRNGQYTDTSYARARKLPTDTAGMARWLRARGGTGDRATFENAGRLLSTSWLPPRVEAAVYRALARMPGLVVVDAAKDAAGRTGVAVALPAEPGTRAELVFRDKDLSFLGDATVDTAAPENSCDTLRPGDVVVGTALMGRAIVGAPGETP